MAKRKVGTIEIKGDRFVVGLIDRLIAAEKRQDKMQKELNEHFEMLAELQPKLTADGQVSVRAMRVTDDTGEEFEVVLQPVTISKQE